MTGVHVLGAREGSIKRGRDMQKRDCVTSLIDVFN